MKPYYESGGITIYHGDCRDVLPTLGRCDFLVTDPPYGVGKAGWDVYPAGSLEAAWALTTRAAFVFWSAFDLTGPAATFSVGALKNTIIWWKPNLPALWMFDRSRFACQWEPLFYHARPGFEPAERPTDVWAFDYPANGANRLHPTQKPISLLRRVIRVCGPGVFLDPFAGSGTTLEAARDAARTAVGIEANEAYCEIAARRLDQEVLELGA